MPRRTPRAQAARPIPAAQVLPGLTPALVQSARAAAARMPAATQRAGAAYAADGRVGPIETSFEVDYGYTTLVLGRMRYTVTLYYEPSSKEWDAFCDCPVVYDCKHIYAAYLTLAEGPGEAPPEAPAPPGAAEGAGFRAVAEEKLGRALAPAEIKIARLVQGIYDQHAGSPTVPESALEQLEGRMHSWSWQGVVVWPRRPVEVWEAWLYLAHELRRRGKAIPAFLDGITPAAEVERLMAPWLRELEVTEWQGRLAAAHQAVRPALEEAELRVVFGERAAELEVGSDEAGWQALGRGRYGALEREIRYGGSSLSDSGRSIWSAFHYGGGNSAKLVYAASAAQPALAHLLRNRLFAALVLTAGRVPFLRPEEPLVWRMEAPEEAEGDYHFALERPGGELLPPPLLVVSGAPGLYVTGSTIFLAPPLGRLPLATGRVMKIPARALETRPGLSVLDAAGLALPERLEQRVERRTGRLVLEGELESDAYSGTEFLRLRVLADWGAHEEPQQWTARGWSMRRNALKNALKPAEEPLILRDESRLADAPAIVERLGAAWDERAAWWERKVSKKFPDVFSEWLRSLPAHVELRLSPELASLREGPLAGAVTLGMEPAGVDWFDLTVDLQVPDLDLTREELEALLSAQGGWVRLGKRGWQRLALSLTDEEEGELAAMGLSPRDLGSGEKQRLHTLQLAHAGAQRMLPADAVADLRERVQELKERVSPPVPATITADMRPYQIEGFHFLAYLSTNHFGGLLADDMGLGKTLQTLAWMMWLRAEPGFSGACSLVFCPKSVMENWQSEATRFAPGLRVQLWRGRRPAELPALVKECDLLVLNYSQLRSLLPQLQAVAWHIIVLDEAQAIKNPDSRTARSACLLPAEHRLALTGTPIENRLLDLWSIMAFAMPGMLGPRAKFARTYDQKDDPFARRRLAARTRPFLLRRTKEEVAKDLPARVEEELLCEMEGTQATLYRAELKRARKALLGLTTDRELDQARFHILTSLLRLRQICCHPGLVDPQAADEPSAKVEALLELLEPLMEEGRKVLVFSQFVGVIEILQKALAERGWPLFILTGQTENRGELIAKFQGSEGAAVFLLSLKASGFGLNLTAASYVVLYDPWWNPAVENQAIDRTHRIGQTSTVFAYRLIIKGSIEEKIRGLQKQKRALADDLFGEEAFARALTLSDLRLLLED